MNLTWPDLVVGAVLVLGVACGCGLVVELTGALALAAAVAAAFAYPGIWDKPLRDATHLVPGSAHVVSMIIFAALAYAAVIFVGGPFARIAKLPAIGLFNAILRAAIGFGWAAAFVWLVLFAAQYFPLSKDVRLDFRKSYLVAVFEQPDGQVDTFITETLPSFIESSSNGIFGRHHVALVRGNASPVKTAPIETVHRGSAVSVTRDKQPNAASDAVPRSMHAGAKAPAGTSSGAVAQKGYHCVYFIGDRPVDSAALTINGNGEYTDSNGVHGTYTMNGVTLTFRGGNYGGAKAEYDTTGGSPTLHILGPSGRRVIDCD